MRKIQARSVWNSLAIVAISLWFLAHSAFQLNHNDFMYAVSAVVPGDLYTDVHFVQAPMGFYALRLVALLAPSGATYLTLRLVSLLLVLLALAGTLRFGLRQRGARLLFLLAVGSSPYLLTAASEIGNYSLALILVAAGSLTLFNVDRRPSLALIAGLLFGLAVSVKLNQVVFLLPLGFWTLRMGRNRRTAIAAAIGLLLGLTPLLVELFRSPDAFLLHNIYFHREFTAAMRGVTLKSSVAGALKQLLHFALPYGTAVGLTLYVAIVRPHSHVRELWFWLSLFLAAVGAALLPGIAYTQYLAPASLFAALAVAALYEQESDQFRPVIRWAVVPFLLLSSAVLLGGIAGQASDLQLRLPPLQVHAIGKELNQIRTQFETGEPDCDDRLFSFAGALTIDSGFTPAKQMEAGIFWSRLRDHVPVRYLEQERYGIDADLLDPVGWIREVQLNFLLVGYYRSHDTGLYEYARENDFGQRRVGQLGDREITLLFRRDCLRLPDTE